VAAYFNRGNGYKALGKTKEAETDYTKVIEMDPEYAAAYNKRGYAYIGQQKFREAIADFAKAIKLDPMYVNMTPPAYCLAIKAGQND
jgi:tetratricopeptide (TPR) repeat protein